MSGDQKFDEDVTFIETCVELQLLNETDAESLHRAVTAPGYAAQEAVKRGLLTPTDVDIVQSLQYPRRTVPGYEIESVLGRGGMGVVYRARQLDLDRIVAIKTILINNVNNPTVAARFEREAKALARLQHPNIVQALNFGRHEGRYFFAMEYVRGRTCEKAIRDDGIMAPDKVWFLVRQVASGLLHALNQNLIHRDIKPANLILVPPPEGSPRANAAEIVKITDFGLAMFADASDESMKLTTGDKIMGSPAYMSPEQFGIGEVDFRTDMYALGATAWNLLFGSPPFPSGNIPQLFQLKTKPLVIDHAALPATIPETHWRLLMGLLDPNPDARPPTYESLIDAIDGLGLSDPTVKPVLSAAQPSKSPTSADEEVTISAAAFNAASDVDSEGTTSDRFRAAMAPTLELVKASPKYQWIRGKWLVAVAVLGLAAISMALLHVNGSRRGPRVFTRVASSTPLFDGVTLKGWDVGGSMVGPWNTVEAPDASTAVACTTGRGALTRRLPDLQNPRITLFAWLVGQDAKVDIDFGFDSAVPSDVRGCLRFSALSLEVGLKNSDFGALDVVARADAPTTLLDRYHVVHLERQQDDWFVFVEEKLIGTLPISSIGHGDAIRLVVHGSSKAAEGETQAYFADLQVSDLRVRNDKPAMDPT